VFAACRHTSQVNLEPTKAQHLSKPARNVVQISNALAYYAGRNEEIKSFYNATAYDNFAIFFYFLSGKLD
jgi:hypothetical protein